MATDRRSFLRLMGAGVATSALYPEIAAALDIPAKRVSGTLQDVKHIVILMQENRSFDHYFGTLKGVRGFGDRHPVPMPVGPVWLQSDGQNIIPPFHLDTKTTNAIAVPGTPHSFADSQAAWNQGRFGYWPKFKNPYSMGYYKQSDIPFQFALAEAFTICDAYHCSITTGTDPNRIVFWSGSNHDPQLRAKGINATEANSEPNNLRCWIKGALPEPGYTYQGSAFDWPTIPDVLEQAGVSWRIYQDPNDNWTGAMHGGLAFRSFRECKPGDPLYEKGMAHWSLEQFAEDARQGKLPAVSWILPPKDWSEHPSASTPLQGAEFTASILKALTANPETWSQSVFFQTFDENDGLFDHAPPPAPPSYRADGTLAGKSTLPLEGFYFSDPDGKYRDPRDTVSGSLRPWGLGPRVPMYVVSPWSKGGFVASEVFDHTSVGQFIEKRFGVVVPAISPWHRAVCGDLTSCFDFDTPNDPAFPPLPDSSNSEREVLRQIHRKAITPPSVPQPLQQESGTRPSRPLPYRPEVTARVGGTDLTLDLRNSGTKGLVLHVYDRLNLDLIPRRYTIEAGKHLSDVWSVKDKAYDLWVSGPNGFLRIFAGQSDFAAETALEIRRNTVVLTLKNHAKTLQKLTMDQSVYGGPVQTVSLHAGKTQSVTLDTGASGGWYDVTVSAEGFLRRYAGRLESGHASISDPAV